MTAKIKRDAKKNDKLADMLNSLHVARTERDKKLDYARKSLVESLEVASEKCLTANGVMQALDILNQINRDLDFMQSWINDACDIARHLSEDAAALAKRAGEIAFDEMDHLCDSLYIGDFAVRANWTSIELARELMVLQLCQNAGSSAADIYEANVRMNEEIGKLEAALDEMEPDWAARYEEMCELGVVQTA